MNNKSKILTAVAAGAAAGAVLGVLFAPAKGSDTRKKISDQSKKLAGDVKDKIRLGKEKLNGLREDVERKIKENTEEFV
jgi:gas vesicle protein